MAFQITNTLRNLSRQRNKQPQIILEIEGIPFLFGARPVETLWKFDDGFEFDTIGLRFDSPVEAPNSLDVIGERKTTKNLTQQVLPDKEGTSSVSTFRLELIDTDLEVTNALSFGNFVDDILGANAIVYSTLVGAIHPTDSIPVLQGYIDDYKIVQGSFLVSISHPENLKRTNLFPEYTDNLTAAVSDSTTSIPVVNSTGLLETADVFTSHIRIEDEIMEVTSKTDTVITVTRGALGTTAVAHDIDSDVNNVYRLNEQAIDLALKLQLSAEDDNQFGETAVESFVDVSATIIISNAIFFKGLDIEQTTGIVAGDSVVINGSTSNDNTYTVTDIVKIETGSYILVDSTLVSEVGSSAVATFISQYNTLPVGLGLTNREVDVQGHIDIDNQNPNTFATYDFVFSQELDMKEFIDKEIYYPVSLYSVPRKAKISLKLVQPPLSVNEIVRLNETSVLNLDEVKIERTTHKFFYNQILYRFGKDYINQKFLAGRVFRNETSLNRITRKTQQLTINSDGLVANNETDNLIVRQQQRLFDRYRFAAQQISNVKLTYEAGFNIEIGDVVVFGSDTMQLTDLSTGERVFRERLVEVINLNKDILNGQVTATLLETSFDLNARYGIVSPSSLVDIGATTTEIPLKLSFDTGEFNLETEKWADFVGERVVLRDQDYTFEEVSTIQSISATNVNRIVVDPPFSIVPPENYIIELPEYEDNSQNIDSIYKDLFVYNVKQATITAVTSTEVFEVSGLDAAELVVGSQIYVHSEDYSTDSFSNEDIEILDITGNTITLNSSLPFLPVIGDKVERSNFLDGGNPYLII